MNTIPGFLGSDHHACDDPFAHDAASAALG